MCCSKTRKDNKSLTKDIIGWKVGWKGLLEKGPKEGRDKPLKANVIDYVAFALIGIGIVFSFAGFYIDNLFSYGIRLLFIGMFIELIALLFHKLIHRVKKRD